FTQFTVTVSGVPSPTTGRLAFRYFVENGGPNGVNSDYIGIDTFQFNGSCASPSPTATATATATFTPTATATATATATFTPTATATATATFTPTATATATATATFTPTATATATATATPAASPTPSPVPSGCVRSAGWWMNHPEAWCLETIQVGCTIYTQAQALSIMRHSTSGDKTYTLAQVLIAEKLNRQCRNSNSSCISQAEIDADNWLCMHPVGSGVTSCSSAWQQIKPTYNLMNK